MKYNASRKINLSKFSKELYAFETEDLGVTDADSQEEATQAIERWLLEREGYYRAKVEQIQLPFTPPSYPATCGQVIAPASTAPVPSGTQAPPFPIPLSGTATAPPAPPAPPAPVVSEQPPAPTPSTIQPDGVSTAPPPNFN